MKNWNAFSFLFKTGLCIREREREHFQKHMVLVHSGTLYHNAAVLALALATVNHDVSPEPAG